MVDACLVDEHPKRIYITWLSQWATLEPFGGHKTWGTSNGMMYSAHRCARNVVLDLRDPEITKNSLAGIVNEYIELFGIPFRGLYEEQELNVHTPFISP
jgi:hypothetical protein